MDGPLCAGKATNHGTWIHRAKFLPSLFLGSPLKAEPRFGESTYALDVSPSQGDLGLPPAMATISSPQGCSMGTMFPHKHLQCAGVQPSHLVPEGQAQVPCMHEVAEREHQASSFSPGGFGCRHCEILSTWNGKSRASFQHRLYGQEVLHKLQTTAFID